MIYIESKQNNIIKSVISLKSKKARDKLGMFILEGERLIGELPKDKKEKAKIICAESYPHKDNCNYVVSDGLFSLLTDTVTPQGILAVCPKLEPEMISLNDDPLLVICEKVADPGNLGTIIRTSDAAGADGVFLSKGCTDLYSPKTVRSTMGSLFHLPIYTNEDITELIKKLNDHNITTIAAHLSGNITPYKIDMKKGIAVVIGNEANGISDKTASICTKTMKIPMPGKAESLNAGIAAGIIIYEAVRQRYEKDQLG